MKESAALGFVLVGAAAAQNAAHVIGVNAVRGAYGVTGAMCPTLSVRLVSAACYFALLIGFVGIIGAVASWLRGGDFARARRTVVGAVWGTLLFLVVERIAFQSGAVWAATLAHVVTTNAVLAVGQAAAAGVGGAVGFAYRGGGPTRR